VSRHGPTSNPPRFVLIGGSLAVIAIALVWFTERAFDLRLFPMERNTRA
jgi:hypothetical protein